MTCCGCDRLVANEAKSTGMEPMLEVDTMNDDPVALKRVGVLASTEATFSNVRASLLTATRV